MPVAGATLLHDWLAGASPEFVPRPRLPSDLAAICYTSGTTGRPKGAMQGHRAVMGAAVGTALMATRTADDRVISALPLFHVYRSCVMNAAMLVGSTLIVIPRFNEVAVVSAIAEHRATIMDGVPTAYHYLLAHADFDRYDLSSLTRCWVGGQTLPAAKHEFTRRTGCPLPRASRDCDQAGCRGVARHTGRSLPRAPGRLQGATRDPVRRFGPPDVLWKDDAPAVEGPR